MKWMGDHKASLVDGGAPLGKTKRVDSKGASDTKNELGGYSVVQAEFGRCGDEAFRQGPPASANARRLGRNHRDHADTRDVARLATARKRQPERTAAGGGSATPADPRWLNSARPCVLIGVKAPGGDCDAPPSLGQTFERIKSCVGCLDSCPAAPLAGS